MHQDILPRVIFSPAVLALNLAEELVRQGAKVTLYTPGPVQVGDGVQQVTADLGGFEAELAARGDTYIDLLKKHPSTFISLARQVQAELITRAYADANNHQLDVVHIYTNEEELALVTAQFCNRPVIFTHHDPFNFLVRYRSIMPRYRHLNWLSLSFAQRKGMPPDTNWVGNIYHGLDPSQYSLTEQPNENYVLFLGRIIEPKGVHLAIEAVQLYNLSHPKSRLKLKIAGKHYSGEKDRYWQDRISPYLGSADIEYVGFVSSHQAKVQLLANAKGLIMPSLFAEPFGLVQLEALACGTPVIGLNSGAIAEVVQDGITGFVVDDAAGLPAVLGQLDEIDRLACRKDFERRFSSSRMAAEHLTVYARLNLTTA